MFLLLLPSSSFFLLKILAVTAGLFVLLELLLRLLGVGNPLIYVADAECGYLLAPDRTVRRLGNLIQINQYSMRSPSIAPIPEPQTLRVLLLGDSVANGGWWTHQTNTISELMARQLKQEFANLPLAQPEAKVKYFDCEVLNASANSWGPRNQLAYAQRFGLFGSQIVVLLLNTDDLFASAPNAAVVGRDRSYPDRQPPLATLELLRRFLPALPANTPTAPAAENRDRVGSNLEAIRQIKSMADAARCQFVLALTPKQHEFGEPGPRDWEVKARERLAEVVEREKITYINFLPIFNSAAELATLYRDSIHLSPQGNQLVSKTISHQLTCSPI
ncbi:SGNH/GDSL hydrolase family protein [Tychonema sp. LEGE 07203]|uniref:SGNH/GDSL hydrolase family protein n=1 Tax=Tychonema sp. LEGE 07203 TaxID=1828671 RepID=UPI00187DF268|nr:SGNH/GDSL hydrolase family protein [Tychonema sp. LEGE 07203]MBE9096277.1 SGNH/GDSL hydrolase family protein [Tychonema sp. LEGE 07203]